GQLKAFEAAGGPPRVICAVAATTFTGTWGSQGEILFSDFRNPDGGIRRVTAQGGTAELAVDPTPDNPKVLWPHFLPDGWQFLYLAFQLSRGSWRLWIGSLAGGEARVLIPLSSRVAFGKPVDLVMTSPTVRFAIHLAVSS